MRTVEIGCVVDPVSNWNPKREGTGAFTYVDISSIDQHTKTVSEPSSVDAAEAPSRARQLIAAGDVLVSTVRPNLNAVAYVKPGLDGATASTGYCVLRPRPNDLDGRYLFHWVRAAPFVAHLVQRATGASYPAVSDKIVKAAPIPLPPIEEQRRIAAVLDAAEALRTMRREALAKLDDLLDSVFYSRFGNYGTGHVWSTATLGEVCEFKYGKSLPKSKRSGHGFGVYGSNGEVGRHHEPLTEGTTIIIGRKGSFGEVTLSADRCWPIDTTYYVDRSATEADLRWLYYRLKTMPLKELNRAAAVPGLNRQDAYAQPLER